MGVINSSRNGNFKSSGQLWWMKLMSNPLMCDPSWSWSVMIIKRPYRKAFKSSIVRYFFPYCNPMILTMLLISAFSINYRNKHQFLFISHTCKYLSHRYCTLVFAYPWVWMADTALLSIKYKNSTRYKNCIRLLYYILKDLSSKTNIPLKPSRPILKTIITVTQFPDGWTLLIFYAV